MRKLFTILMLGLALTGCAFVHKMDIEQGNVITNDMVKQLRIGMTQSQVKEVMGTPMLINTFSDDRIDYVYTFRPGGGKMTEKYVTLKFSHGFLRDISGNY